LSKTHPAPVIRWRAGIVVVIVCATLLSCTAALDNAQDGADDSAAIIGHLNASIRWYRHLLALDVTAGQPSDALYLENARGSAAQSLQYAFQSALAEAAVTQVGKKSNGAATQSGQTGDQQQQIAKALSDTADRIEKTQAQLQNIETQLARGPGKQRDQLVAQREGLKGQLELDKTIQDALQKIVNVATGTQNGGTGLAAQINQLKQSVPEVFATTAKKDGAPATVQSSKAASAQSSGLFGQTSTLLGLMRDMRDLDQAISETTRLRNTADKLAAPLRDSLKSLFQQGQAMVNTPPSGDAGEIAKTRSQFDALTAQFKRLTDAAVPLRQEIILLDDTKGDLVQWRNSIAVEYGRVLRSLLTRVVAILLALGFILLLSLLWRRATQRYIRDLRRRRQFTLVRRFVVGSLMVLVILAGFISEFSSLATFAGFITAGIAVALQTVILSVAAYFFLIGRYGVRVGDRVTVGGVTGDVVEVGLVRLYLMELSGTGIDLYPTGRVVVFSNSVMLQAAPFFKQLPGTSYAWHELAVTVGPEANLALVERKLMDAVASVYSQYCHSIDRQHAVLERVLDTSFAAPAPVGKVQFSDGGPEFVVRYPVEIQRAGEIDDQLTRKLMETISGDPQLKVAVSASPKLRAAIRA
jgi:small-conductance mechanosensitive channel